MSEIRSLVETFTQQLSALMEGQALERARALVESALGVRRPGLPGRLLSPLALSEKRRKKPPIQLCPVPGCKNPAAPVFGMVCANHKDIPKTKIKRYREARKAKKLGIAPAKTARPAKTMKGRKKKVPPKPIAAAKPAVSAAA